VNTTGLPFIPPALYPFKEFHMKRHAWVLPVAALALGVFFLTVARARDEADEKVKIEAAKKAYDDVKGLADAVAKPEELKKRVDAIVKKYDEMTPIMWQMKPVEKGGALVGKPGTFPNDSIELGLLQLGKKPPKAADIPAQAPDLQRLAEYTRAIAEVAPKYASKWAKNKAEEKAWNELAGDMAKGSDDMISAAQKGDEKALKKAINDLNHSCNECHTKFRDN
jgi:cytochrome c556